MDNLDKILEGLLFIAGDPVEKSLIIEKLGVDKKELEAAIKILREKYSKENSGITFVAVKDKIQLASNSDFSEPISIIINPIKEKKLSKATLEVAAIVAYKQPITRLEIEEIRGVNSDYAIQTLMENEIIAVVGRKDAIGRPILFGTTDKFLKRFELENLDQLPDYDELLESIKQIETFDNSLYNNFEIPDEEETLDLESAEAAINSGDIDLSPAKNKEGPTVVSSDMTLEDKVLQEDLECELVKANIIEADDILLDEIQENSFVTEVIKDDENLVTANTNDEDDVEKFEFDDMNDIPDFLKDADDIEIIN